ncbi:hypothetical protein OSB04_028445 [Centaurea solstitialis]|uniref:Uncharacterized protein n=1 Tax=Centaurea solstitialis TaxID=347529 RepID=A0AA38W995_9ASTR|nr:hypothetical protein OSB04_028445 [Centaurea solstitialis]
MDIVTAIVTPVVESLMVPIKKHLGYLISYTKYMRDMGTKRRLLEAKILGVENHVKWNKSNNLEVPTEVESWLEEVAKIDAQVKSIPSDVGSCFNIKLRHKLGRKAFKIIEEINRVIEENSTINWTDHPIPLGKVDSMKASTSTPPCDHNDFKSRERTFMEALKALQPDHKSQMIALCGMGGVGKTTMMEKLKKATEERKLFNIIVKVVIGEKANTIAIQDAVADYLGISLTEKSESARSDRLRKSFENHSEGGKKKILVIFDDVWQSVHLNHIGLSPLPNQGVGFKFLLTSRDQSFCTMITEVEVSSTFKVDVIDEPEARSFFQRFVELSNDDHELQKIGDDIVRRCYGLPIALKTIAITLKDKNKNAWRDALSCLEHHDIDQVVHEVFGMSYKNLQDEEIKSFFLLCGLFPEDFDIPIEELMRYGWGLELFNKVYGIAHARDRLNTSIERLLHANLLISSQRVGCVKMHDLVRDFTLDLCSKGEHMSIVGNMSNWPAKLKTDSCKRISLTCTSMSKLPGNFKFPNLLLLKLMHGDDSFKFPKDFYEDMKNIQVIAYDKMKYPLFCRSLQCSTNLRTLCLHECCMFDFSSVGHLLNLEVLSFAHCRIKKLPSTIGKLKELKLLDVTGCDNLCIDDGVLRNLIKLEELYMRTYKVPRSTNEGIRFTHANRDELVHCSKNLTSLEIEFFENSDLPNNISLKKLERFKISLGCHLEESDGVNMHSFINTLMLVTEKGKLLDSKMNELFEKTEVLHLQVNDMNDLGEVLVESLHHHHSSFHNLRVLHICECVNLTSLFTVDMANGLIKLEYLKITNCHFLKTLVDSENGGVEAIKFQALKFLILGHLPNLMSLCNDVNEIELPRLEELILERLPSFTSIYANSKSGDVSTVQPLLNKEVRVSQLKKLEIRHMEKLIEIWPSDTEEVWISELRVITVERCDSVVNLFPRNPMSLLRHLEELQVRCCPSIDMIFNIDLGSVGEIDKTGICLRKIHLQKLQKLKTVWKIKGANKSGLLICCGLQVVEHLEIKDCVLFKNRFTITVSDGGESGRNNELIRSSQEQEISVISNEDITQVGDTVAPSHLICDLHHPDTISINNCKQVNVAFEMDTTGSGEFGISYSAMKQMIMGMHPSDMECTSHVWKCNWSKFLISQKQQPRPSSSFHNLATISLKSCNNIKYLFSPLMAKLLSNLNYISISFCDVIEEVVSNRDDEDVELVASTSSTNTSTCLFPYLDELYLDYLPNLKRIGGRGGGNQVSLSNTNTSTSSHDQFQITLVKIVILWFPQVDVLRWCLCQYFRVIRISKCDALSSVIPCYAVGQMQKLESLDISSCRSLVEVFESKGACCSTNIDEGSSTTLAIPRLQYTDVPQLSNLKTLRISYCDRLEYVFTFSTLESLMQLEQLYVTNCSVMKVIVKEEHGDEATMTSAAAKVVVFPRLQSIVLWKLPNLAGFILGKNEFRCPSLDHVRITSCPQMKVFTSGHLIAPKLKYIETSIGKYSIECGFNNFLIQNPFSCLDDSSSCPATSEGCACSFYNIITLEGMSDGVKRTFPPNKLLQLQKLKKIHVYWSDLIEEIFEAPERPDCELQSVIVKFPNLGLLFLNELRNLKYIWKNNPWIVLEFPNLTKLHISRCSSMEHVFNSSMVGSLLQLQELHIDDCKCMEVIVKEAKVVVEEACDGKLNEIITLPRLKSLKLKKLPSLKGFCLGKEAFSWPSLEKLEIVECPAIRIFTMGYSTTPELEVIDTRLGKCYLGEDLNSFVKTAQEER